MAITFVGSNTQSTSGTTPINLSLPASNQNDLVIVVSGCQDETKGVPSTSGYTTITDVLHSPGSCRLYASYKFMGSTPDTSVSVPAPGFGFGLGTVALVFRGVTTTTPLDVAVSTMNNGAGIPSGTASGITPLNNNCCIIIAAAAANYDATVGGVSSYLPSPSVQTAVDVTVGSEADVTVAAAYRILSGGAGAVERPLTWSTWDTGNFCSLLLALRPTTASTDFNTVTKANVTTTGKTVVQRELVGISKYRIIYTGRTVNIPDSSVEAIFVDKYRVFYTGKTVNPIDTFRAVTVDKASVLYRGRIVTPRDIQFEDIPRYRTKGLGSGTLSVTR